MLLRGQFGGADRRSDQRAVGDHRDVITAAPDRRTPDRQTRCVGVDGLTRPVPPFGFQIDDRIPAGDRLPQQPIRIRRSRRHHHLQARSVQPIAFGRLRMVFDGADPTERRNPDGHRHVDVPAGPHPVLRQVADDLVERRRGEPVELDLRNGYEAADRHPDRDADDRRLREWRVETPLFAEGFGSPSVTRKTPPSVATSSPKTSTRSSVAIASCSARLIACAMVSVGASGTVVSRATRRVEVPRRSVRRRPWNVGRSMICVMSRLLRDLRQHLFALCQQIRGDVVIDGVEHLGDVEVVGVDDRLAQFGAQSLRLGSDSVLQSFGPYALRLQVGAVALNRISCRPVLDFLVVTGTGWGRRRWCAAPSGR